MKWGKDTFILPPCGNSDLRFLRLARSALPLRQSKKVALKGFFKLGRQNWQLYEKTCIFHAHLIYSFFYYEIYRKLKLKGHNSVIEDCAFVVNKKKTRLYGEKGNIIMTGISLANNEVRIPRGYRRELEQEVFYILNCGYDAHVKRNKIRKIIYLQSIIGKLNYWLMVEPQDEIAKKGYEYLYPIYKERIIAFNG